jgi:hypothetical protein
MTACHVRGSRGHSIREITVDICERDVGEGKFDINILMHVDPQIPKDFLEPFILRTCRAMFGQKMDVSQFDCVWRDAIAIANANATNPIGLEVGGVPGIYNTFEIVIKHPTSRMYTIPDLEAAFLVELNRSLSAVDVRR